MRLNESAVREITRGAVQIGRRDGWYELYRFDEQELERYGGNKEYAKRMRASAGIRFDCHTNSRSFGFDYEARQASTRYFTYFDVWIDGVFAEHVGTEGEAEVSGRFELALPPGEKRLTIYFPCLFWVRTGCPEIDDASWIRGARQERRILNLGDSITQGYDARHPSLAYPAQTAMAFDADFVNRGIGSDVFLAEHLDPIHAFEPDLILVAYGTNDWSKKKSFARFSAECKEYLERLNRLYPQSQKAVITPLWRGDCDRITEVGSFGDAVGEVAAIAAACPRTLVVDGGRLMPHHPSFYSDQRLHPNDLGFLLYAQNLVRELKAGGVWA